MKNWTGNKNSIFTTLAASSHSKGEREINDYYATDPRAVPLLLENESFTNILEPCCGEGHISKQLKKEGLEVTSSDLIKRGYGEFKDFYKYNKWDGDIVTNPPYKYAQKFIEHSLRIIPIGNKIAMFLKLLFLESKGRKSLFINYPPKTLYVSSSRLNCAKNGKFELYPNSAVAYGWYVWEKGFIGNTVIKWIN